MVGMPSGAATLLYRCRTSTRIQDIHRYLRTYTVLSGQTRQNRSCPPRTRHDHYDTGLPAGASTLHTHLEAASPPASHPEMLNGGAVPPPHQPEGKDGAAPPREASGMPR